MTTPITAGTLPPHPLLSVAATSGQQDDEEYEPTQGPTKKRRQITAEDKIHKCTEPGIPGKTKQYKENEHHKKWNIELKKKNN